MIKCDIISAGIHHIDLGARKDHLADLLFGYNVKGWPAKCVSDQRERSRSSRTYSVHKSDTKVDGTLRCIQVQSQWQNSSSVKPHVSPKVPHGKLSTLHTVLDDLVFLNVKGKVLTPGIYWPTSLPRTSHRSALPDTIAGLAQIVPRNLPTSVRLACSAPLGRNLTVNMTACATLGTSAFEAHQIILLLRYGSSDG